MFLYVILAVVFVSANGQFQIPDIKLEAFKNSGLRATMQDVAGIELFGFHGNVNKAITQIDPGELEEDIRKQENGAWVYYNPDLKLTPGDTVNYWVFVQHKHLGYRKIGSFNVSELVDMKAAGCDSSKTRVDGITSLCRNKIIFEDNFSTLDPSKWTVEQYIPEEPDYEFCSYQTNTCSFNPNRLVITPRVLTDQELKNALDLTNGCTREGSKCIRRELAYLPCVASGRLKSKFSFTYGRVEIKAKLPVGDWLYSELYLETDSGERIYIAYVRGNENLMDNFNNVGSSLVYGGPVATKSLDSFLNLVAKKNTEPFTKASHTYKIIWTPENIKLYVDGQQFGNPIYVSNQINFNKNVNLVISLGVGGVNNFPENSVSNNVPKPWTEDSRDTYVNFYKAKNSWLSTWTDPSMVIESVRIKAV